MYKCRLCKLTFFKEEDRLYHVEREHLKLDVKL